MLVDNNFKYQITPSEKINIAIIVFIFYFFNLLTDLKYNNIEFKKLFIDLKALTRPTIGII